MSTRANATLTLKLSRKMKALIERRAAAENFSSPGAFVESLVRQKLEREEKARLDQLLKEGLASGATIPVGENFLQSVVADYKARIKQRAGGAKPRKRKAS